MGDVDKLRYKYTTHFGNYNTFCKIKFIFFVNLQHKYNIQHEKVIKYLSYKNKIYYFRNLLYFNGSGTIFATKGLTYDYSKGLRLCKAAR